MKAVRNISVSVQNGVAVISAKDGGYLAFIGASCLSSAMPGTRFINSVSIAPEKGKKAVIALEIEWSDNKRTENGKHLLEVRWEDEKLKVDLEDPFIPNPDRLGQLDQDRHLIVTSQGQRFVGVFPDIRGNKETEKIEQGFIDKRYRIVDPNTLCRFLVSDLSLEDLEAAATLDKRSLTERELEKVQAELSLTQQKLREQEAEAKRLEKKLKHEDMNTRGLQDVIASYRASRERVLSILANSGSQRTLFGSLPWVKVRKIQESLSIKGT